MAPAKRLAKICGLILMGLVVLVLAAPPAHAEETQMRTISFTWDGDVPPGATLPDALTDCNDGETKLLGHGQLRYKPGQRIETDDGYYEFSGWSCDCEDASYDASWNVWTIELYDHDETLTGTWTFHRRYTVSFAWDGDVPPNAVLPATASGFQGNILHFGSLHGYIPAGHRVVAENGYYEFLGWSGDCTYWDDELPDQLCVEIGDHDVVVTGTWAFHRTYSLTFSWSGDVPPSETLPANSSGYEPNTGIDTTAGKYVAGYRVEAENGYYEFSGWSGDCENATVGSPSNPASLLVLFTNHDEALTGTWTFHANETVPPANEDETVPPANEDETVPPADENEQTPPAPVVPAAPSIPQTGDTSTSTATLAATTAAGLAAFGIGFGMLQSKRKTRREA